MFKFNFAKPNGRNKHSQPFCIEIAVEVEVHANHKGFNDLKDTDADELYD